MARKEAANKKFETALEELEQVIEQMDSGELSLEEALAAYEKGVGLAKLCYQRLNEVEKKIELLVKDKDGNIQLTSYAEPGDDDD